MNAMRFVCQSVRCFCLSCASLLTPLDDQQCTLNVHRGERSAFIRRSCRLLSLHGDASTSLLPRLSEAVTVVPAQIALYYTGLAPSMFWLFRPQDCHIMPPRNSKRVAKKAKTGPPEAEDHVEVQSAVVEDPSSSAAVPATVDCSPQIAAFLGVSAKAGPTRCVAFFAFVIYTLALQVAQRSILNAQESPRTQKHSWMIAEWPPNDRRRSPLMAQRKHRRRSLVAHALLDCRPCIAGCRGLHRGSTGDAGWRLSGRTDRPRTATKIPQNCFTDRSREAQGLQNQLHRNRIVRPLSVPDIFRTLKGSRKVAALCNGGYYIILQTVSRVQWLTGHIIMLHDMYRCIISIITKW